MNNEQFKKLYFAYKDKHEFKDINESNITRINSYKPVSDITILLTSMTYWIIVSLLTTIFFNPDLFSNGLKNIPEAFCNRMVFFIPFIFFVYIFAHMSSQLPLNDLTTKIFFKIPSFFFKKIRNELKMAEHVFTGDLNEIFDTKCNITSEHLKNKSLALKEDLKNYNGIKGSTLLSIFSDINLSKYGAAIVQSSINNTEKCDVPLMLKELDTIIELNNIHKDFTLQEILSIINGHQRSVKHLEEILNTTTFENDADRERCLSLINEYNTHIENFKNKYNHITELQKSFPFNNEAY